MASVGRRLERALERASALLLDNVEELEPANGDGIRGSRSAADHLRLLN